MRKANRRLRRAASSCAARRKRAPRLSSCGRCWSPTWWYQSRRTRWCSSPLSSSRQRCDAARRDHAQRGLDRALALGAELREHGLDRRIAERAQHRLRGELDLGREIGERAGEPRLRLLVLLEVGEQQHRGAPDARVRAGELLQHLGALEGRRGSDARQALERRRADRRVRVARALQHRRQQRLRGDAQRRDGRLRIARADHLREPREALLAGLPRGLGAHQRVGVVEQVAHAAAQELRIGAQPHQAAQGRQTHARVGVVERERDRSQPDLAAGRHQRVQAGAPHVRTGMRRRAHQRRHDAARDQLGHELEQRARGPRALFASGAAPRARRAARPPSFRSPRARRRGRGARREAARPASPGRRAARRRSRRDRRARRRLRARHSQRGSGRSSTEQHGAGQRHRGVEDDALQEGPHPPAQADRHARCRAASARGSRARCRAARGRCARRSPAARP